MPTAHNDAERKAARGTELARTRQLADLSEEMIMEILLRLPTRTLLSLKSVCTSWRNLISAPDFTRNHLHRSCSCDPSLTPPRIAYYPHNGGWNREIKFFSVHSMMDNPSEPTKVARFSRGCDYRVVGSYHGLLCFFGSYANDDMHAILWNPCTGFIFESPQIRGEACFSGFGYDHLSDTIKFFAITRKRVLSGVESSARIYTFGPTSSWRRIDDIPSTLLSDPQPYEPRKIGVFFNSSKVCTINWDVYDEVFYFDMGRETYGRFPLPDRELDEVERRWRVPTCDNLCVLRNCLSVCYEHMKTQSWIVWQMKEYGEAQSWTKLVTIPFHPQLRYLNRALTLQPLYISESDVLLAISPFFTIVLCNLNDGSINFPVIGRSFSQSIDCYKIAFIYHESLVSPNGLQSNSSKLLLRLVKPKPVDS
ncbi:F-box/kelch-repeat protein At3g23880-like [Arachis stenosperma]|uniref:F-box/kelch-repeat protein At3g23880-like n=1 Tax=Arachis stenosperma TaxID=217475 RepID=UPI0025ABD27C|nr:F-box/kelch-repeat protein At3g23880-like [Arachis stenosperma]